MRRILACVFPGALCAAVLCVAAALALRVFADKKPTPEEIIAKAKDVVSLGLVGPFEMQAEVRIATAGGAQKGTYVLDWAAPDRFRREIHLPGYDEVSVANGATLYRKRSTDYMPLVVFRLEELMNPEEMIAEFQRDAALLASGTASGAKTVKSGQLPRIARERFNTMMTKGSCISIPAHFYEELCVDANDGQPTEISRRSTADDEAILYNNYENAGSGFLARQRQYFGTEKRVEEADITRFTKVDRFPPDTFVPPVGAEQLDWCYDENPARLLPFKAPPRVHPEDFTNPETLDAFVSADGTLTRFEMIGAGGAVGDAAIRKISDTMRFSPATCGGKPMASETPVVIGEMDIGMTEFVDPKDFPVAGEAGYTNPECIYCSQPSYSDEGLNERIQGPVVLTLVVMPDGKAHDVRVLEGLGHGLDQEAVKGVLSWQLKPASGPDGKPAAVRMPIEIDFRIY